MAQRKHAVTNPTNHDAVGLPKRLPNAPERSQLLTDIGVIVHRRTTDKPVPFVTKLAVKPGVSILDLLHGDDEPEAGHGIER